MWLSSTSRDSVKQLQIIRIRIHLLARRNLLWDILRLLSSHRAALDLYVILTLWRARGANQPPCALLHIGARRAAPREIKIIMGYSALQCDEGARNANMIHYLNHVISNNCSGSYSSAAAQSASVWVSQNYAYLNMELDSRQTWCTHTACQCRAQNQINSTLLYGISPGNVIFLVPKNGIGCGSMWPSGFKIRRSRVRFPLLVMCRSVGQTSHSILPLPTQQWWVPGGTKKIENCEWH